MTTDPGRGWAAPNFDDRAWSRGPAGFGTPGTPAVRVRTRWDSPAIWARARAEVPALRPGDALLVHLFHDEDVEVFVNGRPLLRERGYVTEYGDVPLDEAQKALFRPGANVIAATCRQTVGGQGLDLGLTLVRGAPAARTP
jgi:hypothetical protein